MEKLYEIEVKKIKVKYEKLIGLTEISDIVIQYITNCNSNIYDFLKQAKNKCVLYSWLDEVINEYNKEKILTYFSTSNI